MTQTSNADLQQLDRLCHSQGVCAPGHKPALLHRLNKGSLRGAREVARLHDRLCFLRAYPDDPTVLSLTETMLSAFEQRQDLRRHRRALADTGIAGTTIYYRFYWPTARWLYQHWPAAISIDWTQWQHRDDLNDLWHLLLPDSAADALEGLSFTPRQWIESLRRRDETDAAFVIRHFIHWRVDAATREKFYDDLDVPLVLAPCRGGPSRTHSKYKPDSLHFAAAPVKPDLPIVAQSLSRPSATRCVGVRAGEKLIDLARIQMITRRRDLYAFMYSDPKDVRILDYPEGLQFICYGLQPQRRSVLEAMYVFLILKNGVPIGYTQAVTLMRSAEINFNVFDEFRATQTSQIFINTLSMVRYLFDADSFVINTQQLGEGNREALRSGAFWFYYKHGFRPRDPQVVKILRAELVRKKTRPGYRSSQRLLKQLARGELYLDLTRPRTERVTTMATGRLGLLATQVLEQHARGGHSNGRRPCMQLALKRLDYRCPKPLVRSRRSAWERWSPIILALPNLSRWSVANKRALIDVVNAKGGQRESDFVRLFNQHKLLQSALVKLGKK